MKKLLAVATLFAVIFCFAACAKEQKEKEIYVEPPTEIITFSNGETAVYEVITDESGEAVTNESGDKEYIPYDPPVTEEGGYLVTDVQGSTIKQSQTTTVPSAEVDNDYVDLDKEEKNTTTAADKPDVENEQTSAGSNGSTTVPSTTKPVSTTKPQGGNLSGSGSDESTTSAVLPEGNTVPLNGTLSKTKAQELVDILSFDNKFDEALCDGDFYAAEKELPGYIALVENAIAQIKADKALYEYVGAENVNIWYSYLLDAQDKYALFMGIVRGTEGDEKRPNAFFTAYSDFQQSYTLSLKVLHLAKTGAETTLYS